MQDFTRAPHPVKEGTLLRSMVTDSRGERLKPWVSAEGRVRGVVVERIPP